MNTLLRFTLRFFSGLFHFGGIVTMAAFIFGLIALALGDVTFPALVVYSLSTGALFGVIGGLFHGFFGEDTINDED